MNAPSPVGLLTAAVTTAAPVLSLIGSQDLKRPTPCSEWTVGDLLQHIAGRAVLSARAARGVAVTAFPEAVTDLLGEDPAGTVADLLDQSAVAWQRSDADLNASCITPIGVMPGTALVMFQAQDVFAHAWDLGKAVGQQPDFDPQLTATMLALYRQTITDDFRGTFFAPAIPAPNNATDLEMLVAFLGRRP
jgi:uncharacterized protein (TIGR03086 family)